MILEWACIHIIILMVKVAIYESHQNRTKMYMQPPLVSHNSTVTDFGIIVGPTETQNSQKPPLGGRCVVQESA